MSTVKTPAIHIEGRRWFQRGPGNTYHTVRIFIDGELVVTTPREYGYGSQYLQTALRWLSENGFAPADIGVSTSYIWNDIKASYDVIDVQRKKDL